MDNKLAENCIKSIKVKGLWGYYDVNWQLHADVNILLGENGTGKSTLLELVLHFWEEGWVSEKIVREISIETEELSLSVESETDLYDESIRGYHSLSEFLDIGIKLLKTFDAPFYTKNEKERTRKPYIKSTLDDDLDVALDSYVDYQLNQNKKLRANGKTYEVVFAKQHYFIDTLNRLFATTEKRVDEEENRLAFLTLSNHKITAFDLSSGEKQLLIILLTVLCQDEKPAILLLDEPEISLHLRWQYELIDIIRTLNPNCQIIIATHSPSIYGKGWRDKVFFMDKIVTKSLEQTV